MANEVTENAKTEVHKKPQSLWLVRLIESIVFLTRWVLIIFIVGLLAATIFLAFEFILDLVALPVSREGKDITLAILVILEKFMVALVLVTTALGTYVIFLRPFNPYKMFQGAFLEGITLKDLEITMQLSLAGVTGIGLLRDFHDGLDWYHLSQHLAIHFTFILSPLAIALIWKWMHPTTR